MSAEKGNNGDKNNNNNDDDNNNNNNKKKNKNENGKGKAIKFEEVKPHPVMETLSDIQFCINSNPPLVESILLGFQHAFLAVGIISLVSSMIVPKMGGSNVDKTKVIQHMMFVSGINTLLQTLIGTRLPILVGASHAFIIPTMTIVLASRFSILNPLDPHQPSPQQRFASSMAAVQGSLMISSALKLCLGFSGIWRNIVRFLSPLSMALLITFTGLGLFDLGFPTLANCVEIGLPQLIIMIFCSQYLSTIMKTKNRIYEQYSMAISTFIVWIFALILTSIGAYNQKPPSTQLSCRTDQAGLIREAPWIYFPRPFLWGKPTLHLNEAFLMILAGIVSLTESTGTFIAAARYASATPVPPSVISRGVFWLGFGTLLNGVFGSVVGSAASVESAGLLGLTRVGSRRVVQISAGFLLFFSIFGKLGAFLASVPSPIMAASYCIFYAFVAAAGLNHLQFCNLNSFRTLFILGFSSFASISVPQYFRDYKSTPGINPFRIHSDTFGGAMTIIFISSPMVAVTVSMLLDNTVNSEGSTRNDSGKPWWERFTTFGKEIRNAEFYSLPCKLGNCFPSL